jgi:hypothetical protein
MNVHPDAFDVEAKMSEKHTYANFLDNKNIFSPHC